MSAGGGDFQRALSVFLTLDVGEICDRLALDHRAGLRLTHHLHAAEVVDQGDQIARGQDRAAAGPGGFGAAGFGADQAKPQSAGGDGGGQGSGDLDDRAVQRQLAHRRPAVERAARDDVHRRQDAQRDRQVVMTALLGQVRRGQIDHQTLGRQRQAKTREGGAHPLAALADGLVAEADDDEVHVAADQLHLTVDALSLDAFKGQGDDARDHVPRSADDAGLGAVRVPAIARG